jgi:IS1 family transposase
VTLLRVVRILSTALGIVKPPCVYFAMHFALDSVSMLKHNEYMNRLKREKQIQIIASLVEGNSLRATARMCDVAFNSVLKLLPQIGMACADYQDRVLRNLKCKHIQCDECWTFCYAKDKNLPADKQGQFGFGSVWTWVAIDADTKLVPSFMVGNRDLQTARIFIDDLKSRLANRVQLTTDGLKVYLDAVEGAFGSEVDYAQLVKLYESSQEETRYSPAECVSCERKAVMGKPDPKHISTSYVERQNLSMRMGIRRFTRLTNAFSKKVENHAYSVALYFMHYNFAKVHGSLRVTPAMEAGVSDHVWSIDEIVALLPEPKAKKRGPYKKRISN